MQTPVCADVAEVARELQRLRDARRTSKPPLRACASLPPERIPSRCSRTQHVTQRPRYVELIEQLQYPARRELIFGLHVHVGMPSAGGGDSRARPPASAPGGAHRPQRQLTVLARPEQRARIDETRGVRDVPPLRAAASIRRLRAVRARRLGLRVRPATWTDYTHLWWDLRPHPRLGTLEVRVMDTVPRIDDALALVAYVQALTKHVVEDGDGAAPHDAAHPRVEVAGDASRARGARLHTSRLRAGSRCGRAHARTDRSARRGARRRRVSDGHRADPRERQQRGPSAGGVRVRQATSSRSPRSSSPRRRRGPPSSRSRVRKSAVRGGYCAAAKDRDRLSHQTAHPARGAPRARPRPRGW